MSSTFYSIAQSSLDNNAIPMLPNDVMLMIFNELTTVERAAIITASKRFREIDIEFGKRFFESINVTLDQPNVGARIIGKVTDDYTIYGNSSRQILPTYNNIRLFGKSKTEFLRIFINRESIAPSEYYFLLNSCEKISFNKVHINIRCDNACIERIFEIIKNRDLSKSQLFLDFFGTDNADVNKPNFMQLPQVEKLKLNWCAKVLNQPLSNPELIIDDQLLFHIVSNTNHAELGNTLCTPQGIMDAFKVFCNSSNYKYLSLKVPSSVFVDVFRLNCLDWTSGRFTIHTNREVFYKQTRSKLIGHDIRTDLDADYFIEVEMGKVDAQSVLRYERIAWN